MEIIKKPEAKKENKLQMFSQFSFCGFLSATEIVI